MAVRSPAAGHLACSHADCPQQAFAVSAGETLDKTLHRKAWNAKKVGASSPGNGDILCARSSLHRLSWVRPSLWAAARGTMQARVLLWAPLLVQESAQRLAATLCRVRPSVARLARLAVRRSASATIAAIRSIAMAGNTKSAAD